MLEPTEHPTILAERQRYAGLTRYFKKHWHGDFSLAWSYWVNTLVISVIGAQLVVLALPFLTQGIPVRYRSLLALISMAAGLGLWLWAIAGTWASANKHVSRGGAKGWAVAVKVLIVFGMLKTFGSVMQMLPGLQEHVDTAFGLSPAPDTRIVLMADGKTIRLSGGINEGAAQQLRQSLDTTPDVQTVILNSPGGWIKEGEKIAQLIQAHQLNTYVETECASACTIAFLAGRDRAADPDARIGFHALKFVGSGSNRPGADEQRATLAAYEHARLPRAFMEKIGATPTNEMWYPTHAELLLAGVLSRKSFGGESSALSTAMKSRADLVAKFREIELFQRIEEKYPATFTRVIDRAWSMVEQNKSDAEVMAAGRVELSSLAIRLIARASDPTLLAYYELLIAQGIAAQRIDPRVCVGLFFPEDEKISMGTVLPKDLIRRELTLLESVLVESDSRPARSPSDSELEEISNLLFAEHTTEEIAVLANAQTRRAQHELACESMLKYLRAFASLPEMRRIHALRVMFSAH